MNVPTPPLLLFLLAIAAVGAPAGAIDRYADGFPDLPKDARKVAERSLACRHFSGEVSGTGDERDRQVAERLEEYRCDRIERDLERMRKKYRRNDRILKALEEAALGPVGGRSVRGERPFVVVPAPLPGARSSSTEADVRAWS